MSRTEVSFINRDKFMQLGLAIAFLRKLNGMSQEELADKAEISRSHLSAIESPNLVRGMSLNTLFNISCALNVSPSVLTDASVFPDKIMASALSAKIFPQIKP